MKWGKICPLIAATAVIAAVGHSHCARPVEQPPGAVLGGDEFRLFVTSSASPEGRWLALVPWEEMRDVAEFDDLVPFGSVERVLAVKDGKCALISRRTATDRVNSSLETMK